MKLAVISCIHGNYEALTAVLSDIEAQKADRVYLDVTRRLSP